MTHIAYSSGMQLRTATFVSSPFIIALCLLGCKPPSPQNTQAQPRPKGLEKEIQMNIEPPKTATDFSHRITHKTEYYRGGPQQSQPADGFLEAGTKVSVVDGNRLGNYVAVETETGISGYVDQAHLAPIDSP